MANHPEKMGMVVSCDTDDTSMTRNILKDEFTQAMKRFEWSKLCFSPNKSKIEACNANMDEVNYPWDIVVLVSDDMIPQVNGYDDVIRNYMLASFPDTNGILWFNDGCQGDKLNTLCVFGRKMYDSFGYIYHPAYKSLFCDTELTDLCRTSLKSNCVYVPYCIIRHEHPGTGFAENMDSLYVANQRFWNEDMYTYISRKHYDYDWSVLIPSISRREASLEKLLKSIREKTARIAPQMRVEIKVDYDNRETSIGSKRQRLLQSARGKYMSFVDDDDDITDEYIHDLWACMAGGHQVMRLRGNILPYTFTHSIEVKLSDPMARDNTFVRPPNHLNPMMTDVAKLISFQDAVRGEDMDWTIRMAKAGFLTNEYRSDPSRIHYIYNLGERAVTKSVYDGQTTITFNSMLNTVYMPSVPVPEKTATGLRWGPRGFVSK
jgi:hypothetical protein